MAVHRGKELACLQDSWISFLAPQNKRGKEGIERMGGERGRRRGEGKRSDTDSAGSLLSELGASGPYCSSITPWFSKHWQNAFFE